MKLSRRQVLQLSAGVAVLPGISRIARAQAYPTRPIRLIVGFPAGGTADIGARLMAQWLSERLGQPFVVDNRPGAGGSLGTEAVVRAPADGYTLLQVGAYNVVNAASYANLTFNFVRDIAPIGRMMGVPLVVLVHPSLPAKTIPEFIAYAKTNVGKLNMAVPGNGTTLHVAGELFKMMTGTSMVNVPYRGAPPALTDLLSGQIQIMFDFTSSSLVHIRAGKLRALAVTTTTRAEALPDLPTVGEFVAGYEASGWFGLGAPRSTPADIVEKLNREINVGLNDPGMKARFADLGATALPGLPGDFGKLIIEEAAKWAKVVEFAGIKPD